MKTFTTPEQGFRDFDLPKKHLPKYGGHYIPPKAFDPVEVSRRRQMAPGSLLAEQQAMGVRCADKILELVTEEEGLLFASDMLAMAGLNTAWYSYAERAQDVMRRRLHLPLLSHGRARVTDTIIEDVHGGYAVAISEAIKLRNAIEHGLRAKPDRQKKFGRSIGNTSLRLAVMRPAMEGVLEVYADDEPELQDIARRHALLALEAARDAHEEMHAHPSMVQLSDPFSPLTVYWRNNAPPSARTAVHDALESLARITQ